MVDSQRQSALSGIELRLASEAISIRERRISYLLQINGAPVGIEFDKILHAIGLSGSASAGSVISSDDLTLLWNGPQMWLTESDSAQAIDGLSDALQQTAATLTEVSHGRTVLRLSGQCAAHLISKGCPFDIEQMRDASVISSHIGHLNVMIHKIDAHTFDLFVFRSFGQALYEWLDDAASQWPG